jgi:hypothetical protein
VDKSGPTADQHDAPGRRDPEAGPRDPEAGRRDPEPGAGDDFADEHSSPTFADQAEGGPERAPEPESPEGHAGMD